MAERNAIKIRACKLCGERMVGKASTLKKHGRTCKQEQADAAAQAIMDKIKAEMLEGERGV